MILSARQLEDLHKAAGGGGGQIVLPYRAKLTPLAADWVRQKKIAIGYADVSVDAPAKPELAAKSAAVAAAGALLWWCDGPCGPAKAAIAMQAKALPLTPMDIAADAKKLAEVIRKLSAEVKSGRAMGGVLVLHSAAAAVVLANRCPSLRAIIGTCREAVAEGLSIIGANVLIVEHPYKTLQQMSNLLAQFARGPRAVNEDVKRQLAELANCG